MKQLGRSYPAHTSDLVANRRVFDFDTNEPKDNAANANDDAANDNVNQASNTDNIFFHRVR